MKDNNNFLGRWLNGDISEDELEQFKKSEDYNIYQSYVDGISKFKVEDYPEDIAYSEFRKKLENRSEEHENNPEDSFLGRWINKDISEDELEQFEKSDDYETYKSFVDGVSKLKVEDYPQDVAYSEFKDKLKNRSKDSNIEYKDNFLGRWLDENVSEDELEQFEKSDDYHTYKSLLNGISKLTIEDYTEDVAYSEFKEKLENKSKSKGKVIKFPVMRYAAIAASIAILLGIGYFATNKTYETQIASQESIILPDNSRVSLNAKSKLSYNKILFGFNRKLKLEGEAFFEVEKGSTFTVMTNNGAIQVLGTKFNVVTRDDYFETTCFEGKVAVTTSNDSSILTKGKQVRHISKVKEKNEEDSSVIKPSWIDGVSKFKSTPVKYVIENIEINFGVVFDTNDLKDTSLLYTGSFSHDDLQNAMENVFLPMGIEYKVDKKTSTIVLKNK